MTELVIINWPQESELRSRNPYSITANTKSTRRFVQIEADNVRYFCLQRHMWTRVLLDHIDDFAQGVGMQYYGIKSGEDRQATIARRFLDERKIPYRTSYGYGNSFVLHSGRVAYPKSTGDRYRIYGTGVAIFDAKRKVVRLSDEDTASDNVYKILFDATDLPDLRGMDTGWSIEYKDYGNQYFRIQMLENLRKKEDE